MVVFVVSLLGGRLKKEVFLLLLWPFLVVSFQKVFRPLIGFRTSLDKQTPFVDLESFSRSNLENRSGQG